MRTSSSLRRFGRLGGLAAAVILAALAGCGGSNDDQPGATASVPGSASTSAAGFIAYLQDLVVSSADTLEPVDTSAVTAQVDDTGEPVALN